MGYGTGTHVAEGTSSNADVFVVILDGEGTFYAGMDDIRGGHWRGRG